MSCSGGPLSKTPALWSTWGWYVCLQFLAAVMTCTMGSPWSRAAPEALTVAVISSSAQAHFSAGQMAEEQKDYAKAEREYRAAIALAPQFAPAYMRLGCIDQLRGQLSLATQNLRKALDLEPGLSEAKLFLGINYCRLGRSSEAVPYLKAAVREKPDQPMAWVWLATALEMKDLIPEELRVIQEGLQVHPQNVDLLYMQGHVFEGLARDDFSRLQQMAPGSDYAEELWGEADGSSGYLSAAIFHLRKAIVLAPQRPDLHLQLGEVYLRAGNLTLAGPEFEAELRLDDHNLAALVRRGEIKLLAGDVGAALDDWSRVITLDDGRAEVILGIRAIGLGDAAENQLPDSMKSELAALKPRLEASGGAAAHLALAFLAAQAGDSSSAASEMELAEHADFHPPLSCRESDLADWLHSNQFRAAAYCGPRTLTARSPEELRMGVIRALYETGDFQPAIALLNAPLSSRPLSPQVVFWRARCYRKAALQTYLQLYQVSPDSYRVHQLLGDFLAAQNNDAQAISEYRKALEQEPSLWNVHYSLAHLLFGNLKVEEASQEFAAELRLNPHHAAALLELGALLLHENKPAESLSYLRRALAEDPGNLAIHGYLGRAYVQLRRYPEAEKELKLAAAEDTDGSVYDLLGRVYKKLGRTQEAASAFSKSQALLHESQEKRANQAQALSSIESTLK